MSIAIKIENLSKQYRLGLVSTRTLSHDLNRWWQTTVLRRDDPYLKIGQENKLTTHNSSLTTHNSDYVWALKDINLEVEEGEVLGIIGKNGAGKSTILKILSKVTAPTTGIIKARGRIASLLEVGTGFHQEMTGRENIYMNGSIMGMTKAEIRKKLDEIVDFAGVGRYIDTPVKRYSSGMTVRLGFAVAAHLEPEILVVDEVLAVGDAEFQDKAIGKMQEVSRGKGRTVLFVSHNMGAISQLCSKVVLFKEGRVNLIGGSDDVIKAYLKNNKVSQGYIINETRPTKKVFFNEIKILDESRKGRNEFFVDEPIYISFNIKIIDNTLKYNVFCIIQDENHKRIFAAESEGIAENMKLRINPHFLVRGDYSIHTFIHVPRIIQEDVVENTCNFSIIDNWSKFQIHGGYDYGSVFGSYKWVEG
jgi:lipopolysaccharide transport system ATP-binding protein